ncbi:hypothetical protein NP233_g10515 [Leucocoprinus birnbaumii]|uniref:Inhibitor of growth protein N-terminal histone-binding domain-containing protein n=1 Tax=Leucocoprinus birnbaumii TaxID=56174 RepID=A0AAD5VP53_9AGAR|nr:hypothetical protein NP233_g10515 [Leucocoprinus birnbaumii]
MSARTRSSARKQALQEDPEESDRGSDVESEEGAEQSFSLEEKEQEIWDEVRDEHFDIIEQLPLTIHRQLTLLHQLDCQSRDYADSLLPTIKQYIHLRRHIARKPVEADPHFPPPVATPDAMIRPAPSSTRGLLAQIGLLSEEYLRTSREKVNIAQTAQDSVDRQIRLLDQFIKEQEASLGPEPNAPVMLSMSELIVPKWSRPTRVSMSPMPEEFEQQPIPTVPPAQTEASVAPERPVKRRPPKGRKSREKEPEEPGAGPPLKITLPPPHPDFYIDPNDEVTWCYCNRISFGKMIGCDDPDCKYEWFHLDGEKRRPGEDNTSSTWFSTYIELFS